MQLLVADEQLAEAIEPGVCHFDDPSTRLVPLDFSTSFFAARADVWRVVAVADRLIGWLADESREDISYPDFLTGVSFLTSDGTASRFSTFKYEAGSIERAQSTEHADVGNGGPQEKFTLSYLSTITRITNAVGTIEDMTFATNLDAKNLTQKKNLTDNKTLTQTFDANNNLTCRKDEEGRVTRWSYNATNQKIGMTEGLTGTCPIGTTTLEARTTTYDYLSPTLDLPRFIRRPSVASGQTYETEMVYGDTRFPNLPTQIIQRGFTPTESPVSRTLTMGYNGFGEVNSINLKKAVDPRP